MEQESRNWADEVGRKVWISIGVGKFGRKHTSGVIKGHTKTLILVQTKDGDDLRFKRNGVLSTDDQRQEYGGNKDNANVLSRNNYMGLQD